MKTRIFVLLLIIFSCQNKSDFDIYKVSNYDNSILSSVDSIKLIDSFNAEFWELEKDNPKIALIFPYDFSKVEFSNYSNYGIKLKGIPFDCYTHIHCKSRSRLKLFIDSLNHLTNDDREQVTTNQLKNLMKSNILNFGKEPMLSDKPTDAIISIQLDTLQHFSSLQKPLFDISKAYLTIINDLKSTDNLTEKELLTNYPLQILLEKYIEPPLMPKILSDSIVDEIEGEIEIDLN